MSMGKMFQEMGKEMENSGSCGTNWKITKDIKEFHHLLYRELSFWSQGANKQAKVRTKNVKKAKTEEDEVRSV